VVVDGTSYREHDPARWEAVDSPLVMAQGGSLVILEPHALPHDVQEVLVRALRERRVSSHLVEPFDVRVVLVRRSETSWAEGLTESLRERATLDPVILPRLRERAQDIEPLLREAFAREGLRQKGHPIGLGADALAVLLEHAFEGEDAELDALVTRVTMHTVGERVTAADVKRELSIVTSAGEPALRVVK
jgi:DNA-binding NtrC family response regulator